MPFLKWKCRVLIKVIAAAAKLGWLGWGRAECNALLRGTALKCSKQEPSRRVLYPLPRSSNVLEVARSWKQRWVPSLGRAAGWEGGVGPGAVCSCRAAHVPSGMLVKQLECCHQCILWEGVTKPVSPPEGRRAVCSCGMCWWAVPGVWQGERKEQMDERCSCSIPLCRTAEIKTLLWKSGIVLRDKCLSLNLLLYSSFHPLNLDKIQENCRKEPYLCIWE